MADPLPENTQYIRIDGQQFYIASVVNHQVNSADLAGQLLVLCEQALSIGATLRLAADAGVEKAAALVTVLNAVAAFSDPQAAAAFLAALRAARDA